MITDFHAKYYAYELNRIGGAGVERVGRGLFEACQIKGTFFSIKRLIDKLHSALKGELQ